MARCVNRASSVVAALALAGAAALASTRHAALVEEVAVAHRAGGVGVRAAHGPAIRASMAHRPARQGGGEPVRSVASEWRCLAGLIMGQRCAA
jgi:hypothetical protein